MSVKHGEDCDCRLCAATRAEYARWGYDDGDLPEGAYEYEREAAGSG